MSRDTIYGYYRSTIVDNGALSSSLKKLLSRTNHKMDSHEEALHGIICVRLDRPPKEQQGVGIFRASFAFCSPEDVKHFSRKKARMIADSRMNTKRVDCVVTFDSANQKPDLHSLFLKAISLAFNDERDLTPDWFDHSENLEPVRSFAA
jgi:hypothetical protein